MVAWPCFVSSTLSATSALDEENASPPEAMSKTLYHTAEQKNMYKTGQLTSTASKRASKHPETKAQGKKFT